MDQTDVERRLEDLEEYVKKQRARELASVRWEGEVAQELKSINKSIASLTSKVEQMIDKPAKHWDTVIAGLISAFVAFIVSKLTSGV